jgi:hypothetical protein
MNALRVALPRLVGARIFQQPKRFGSAEPFIANSSAP